MTQPYGTPPGQSPGSGPPGQGDGELKARAQQVGDQAKAEAQQRLDRQKQGAADRLERIADSVRVAASELERGEDAQLSQYVSSFAGSLAQLAEGLRNKNVDELAHDLRGMARRNPGLFVAGAVAVGFGVARFARASAQRTHGQDSAQQWGAEDEAMGAWALDGGSSGGYRGSLSTHGGMGSGSAAAARPTGSGSGLPAWPGAGSPGAVGDSPRSSADWPASSGSAGAGSASGRTPSTGSGGTTQ